MSDIRHRLMVTIVAVPLMVAGEMPSLPIPPIPPEEPPSAELAPIPDPDAQVPVVSSAARGLAVNPGLFTTPEQFRGDGFSRGSTAQQVQERQLRPTPGVRLSMPIN